LTTASNSGMETACTISLYPRWILLLQVNRPKSHAYKTQAIKITDHSVPLHNHRFATPATAMSETAVIVMGLDHRLTALREGLKGG